MKILANYPIDKINDNPIDGEIWQSTIDIPIDWIGLAYLFKRVSNYKR